MRTTLDPTLDIIFKLLFEAHESREALISLLTAVLRPARPIREVRVLNPGIRGDRVDDKFIVLDILVLLDDGTRIDVEMQATGRLAFTKRALYYWARTFTTQLKRGQHYSALRPVVSVLFLDYVELDTPRFHSTFRLLEVHEHFPFSDAIELHVIELPKRNQLLEVTRQEDADLLAWARFLGATSDEEVKEACMSNPAIAKANEVLSSLSDTPSGKEYARRRQLAFDGYRIEMGAEREAGLAEGRAGVLRTVVIELAEDLGIELDEAQRDEIKRSSPDELEALRHRLRKERHPTIAKANEVLSSLSDTPSGKEYARRRQLAFDGYRIEMGAERAAGRAEVLRTVVIELAEDLGIELDEARRDEIKRASPDELEALRHRLRKERHW